MARYIDADILICFEKQLCELDNNPDKFSKVKAKFLKNYVIPTIEGFKVADVEEVKHGEWIYETKYYKCSICAGKRFNLLLGTDAEFCPYCGAKMDGENVSDTSDEDLHRCTGHLFRQVKIKRKWNE